MHDLSKLLTETDYYSNEFFRRDALDKYESFLKQYEELKESFSIQALEMLSRNTPVYELLEIVNKDTSNVLFNFLYNYLLLPNITSTDVPVSGNSDSFHNITIKEKLV